MGAATCSAARGPFLAVQRQLYPDAQGACSRASYPPAQSGQAARTPGSTVHLPGTPTRMRRWPPVQAAYIVNSDLVDGEMSMVLTVRGVGAGRGKDARAQPAGAAAPQCVEA